MARLSDHMPAKIGTLGNPSGYKGIGRLVADMPRRSKGRRAIHAKPIKPSARDAVSCFVQAMADEGAGGYLPFSVWSTNYAAMRLDEGWPPVSDRVLSMALQDLGCRRQIKDDRRRGKGRYVVFHIPEAA